MKVWKVSEMIRYIESDGWYLKKIRGDHRHFVHAVKKGKVTIYGQ